MKISKILGVVLLFCATIMPGTVQAQLYKSTYFNIDWQFNAPLGTDFANVASGWGMNFEGGYYVAPKLALGLYGSFHTNNKYVEPQVLQLSSSSALYTDQIQLIFHIPFGALLTYRFVEDSMFEPYVAAKIGTNYVRMSSVNNVLDFYDESWGFNVQPEVGVSIFPSAQSRTGIHLGLYYSYSTNQNKCLIYNLNGLSNVGFNLGVIF
ncbi:MAG: outer membrane beta-barrel protein [Bacteroidales bacterium]|nr:outer membrane beta-barrel protein [Bacteroidales bacterium]